MRFNNVSNRQYMLSTFDPVAGSVSTSFPQTTPTAGPRTSERAGARARRSIIVLASDKHGYRSRRAVGMTASSTAALPVLAVIANSRTRSIRVFLDDIRRAIAARSPTR